MNLVPISLLTICGLEELSEHGSRGVTHVLSILDPDYPEPEALRGFDPPHRVMLRFHDAIEPAPGLVIPSKHHVETVLDFGRKLADPAQQSEGHLLVHCHVGVSRSTAAVACLLTQAHPDEDEDRIFARLLELRPKAWPNSRMIGLADELLNRGGRLNAALARLYQRQLSGYPKLVAYMRENGRLREVQMAEAA
ncbi:MAG TPA: protein-tyrosine-phosphatase [Bradyrhizobium sp.]|nr:protein-tyrosine-phosphatase [Bradyrhizobium sp.]